MTTITRTRRCDAKCQNGKRAECNCICGGKNHGSARIATMGRKPQEEQDSDTTD